MMVKRSAPLISPVIHSLSLFIPSPIFISFSFNNLKNNSFESSLFIFSSSLLNELITWNSFCENFNLLRFSLNLFLLYSRTNFDSFKILFLNSTRSLTKLISSGMLSSLISLLNPFIISSLFSLINILESIFLICSPLNHFALS